MNHSLDPKLKRWLVGRAETIADDASRKRGQKAQLQNILQIAQVEFEVPVLRNFLEYQAGRRSTKDFWSPIHSAVTGVLGEIEEKLPDDPERRKLAIRSFFGYMVRRYVYTTQVDRKAPANPSGGGRPRSQRRERNSDARGRHGEPGRGGRP